jgi:hypothetical protein
MGSFDADGVRRSEVNPTPEEKALTLRLLMWLLLVPIIAYWRGREAAYRRVNDYNRGVVDARGGGRRGFDPKG